MKLLNYITKRGDVFVVCDVCGAEIRVGRAWSEDEEKEIYEELLEDGFRCPACGANLNNVIEHLLEFCKEAEDDEKCMGQFSGEGH